MAETKAEKKARLAAEAEAEKTRRAALTDEERAAEDAAEEAAPKNATKKVVFIRKDGSKREFNADLHGEDFVKLADEFATTNAKFIAERQDL